MHFDINTTYVNFLPFTVFDLDASKIDWKLKFSKCEFINNSETSEI